MKTFNANELAEIPRTDKKRAVAFSYRSGHIVVGLCEHGGRKDVPDGALPLMEGPIGLVANLISANARHAYDGETLLVPGIPEATDDEEALRAHESFMCTLSRRRSREAA